MKLIALRDFRNPNPKQIKIDDALNENHIHNGARFEIDETERPELVATLNVANAIGDATNAETCRAIDAEVQHEALVEKRQAEALQKR